MEFHSSSVLCLWFLCFLYFCKIVFDERILFQTRLGFEALVGYRTSCLEESRGQFLFLTGL